MYFFVVVVFFFLWSMIFDMRLVNIGRIVDHYYSNFFSFFFFFYDLLFLINEFREKYKYEWTVYIILGLVISVIASIPIDLEIKDTTDRPASYLDLHLNIGSEVRLRTKLNDKRDDFNFPIVKFPFICNSIPAASAYGIRVITKLPNSEQSSKVKTHKYIHRQNQSTTGKL